MYTSIINVTCHYSIPNFKKNIHFLGITYGVDSMN